LTLCDYLTRYYLECGIEFIPLALPDNIADATEYLLPVTLGITYPLNWWNRFIPYLGIGGGLYADIMEQDVPGFGTISDTQALWGGVLAGRVRLEALRHGQHRAAVPDALYQADEYLSVSHHLRVHGQLFVL